MKTKLYFLFLMLSLSGLMGSSCTKDADKGDPIFALPPETQVGANTFGVTIRGKVYVPRDPTGVNYGGSRPRGMIWWDTSTNQYLELEVVDGASSVGFKIILHIQNLQQIGAGQYILKSSNFQERVSSIADSHIFFKIWDANISNYAYYGSVANEGVINITRYDTANFITSGNFSGNFSRSDNPSDIIQITNGRFDIGPGLYDKVFP